MAADTGLSKLPRRRRWTNALTAQVVALGGGAVIVAIALIFFYLLWVVAPIFAGADIEPGERYDLPAARPLLIEANESEEIGLRLDASGQAVFFELESGQIRKQVDL